MPSTLQWQAASVTSPSCQTLSWSKWKKSRGQSAAKLHAYLCRLFPMCTVLKQTNNKKERRELLLWMPSASLYTERNGMHPEQRPVLIGTNDKETKKLYEYLHWNIAFNSEGYDYWTRVLRKDPTRKEYVLNSSHYSFYLFQQHAKKIKGHLLYHCSSLSNQS